METQTHPEYFPGLNPCRCLSEQRISRHETCTNIMTNIFTILISLIICSAGLYYFENFDTNFISIWRNHDYTDNSDIENTHLINELRKEIQVLRSKIDQTDIWRKHLEELYTKIYLKQEAVFEEKLAQAFDVYDSDKIGLFDYASVYASGSVISTPLTTAYPVNKSISFLSLLSYDVKSDPENLIQPNNLPGNCYAFYGSEGRIRIRLGKSIPIKAITLDHIKLYEDRSSAPKDFQIYGLDDCDDESGILLGKFTYDINGRSFQTFQINNNLTFQYVELHILNNYGKFEFTCVYRFRVHSIYFDKTEKK